MHVLIPALVFILKLGIFILSARQGKKIFHLLVLLLKGPQELGWARTKADVFSSPQVSHTGGKDWATWAVFCCHGGQWQEACLESGAWTQNQALPYSMWISQVVSQLNQVLVLIFFHSLLYLFIFDIYHTILYSLGLPFPWFPPPIDFSHNATTLHKEVQSHQSAFSLWHCLYQQCQGTLKKFTLIWTLYNAYTHQDITWYSTNTYNFCVSH